MASETRPLPGIPKKRSGRLRRAYRTLHRAIYKVLTAEYGVCKSLE